jgi:hypothetical protein
MTSFSKNNCLRYWDQCETVTIDAAISLWCDVEPSDLAALNYSTHCMDVKRHMIEEALRSGRLDYESRPVPYNARIDELIEKGYVRLKKDSLRRWFMDMPTGDRPAFLFDESRNQALPDGSGTAEMNTQRALALMAWILSKNKPAYMIGGRPNASEIAKAIEPLAKECFGEDVRGFASFSKKLGKALELLNERPDQYF